MSKNTGGGGQGDFDNVQIEADFFPGLLPLQCKFLGESASATDPKWPGSVTASYSDPSFIPPCKCHNFLDPSYRASSDSENLSFTQKSEFLRKHSEFTQKF